MSNKGLNSNEALDERMATNSSVRLSGIRRLKEAVIALDIKDYTPDPAFSHGFNGSYQRSDEWNELTADYADLNESSRLRS